MILDRSPASSILHNRFKYDRQLVYIENYIKHAEVGCLCIVAESWYIDRDFMEDYSAFYSRCLTSYPNHCKRLHFFSCEEGKIKAELDKLTGSDVPQRPAELLIEVKNVLSSRYLGFTVIRPFNGAPVGRTVLRPFPKSPAGSTTELRAFPGVRLYTVHLFGIELFVEGVAFQQQDVGVSACSSTSVWTSLQRHNDSHQAIAFSPSQITLLASRCQSSFGRTIPTDRGLNIEQMCQVIQEYGLSPVVHTVSNSEEAKRYIGSYLNSGFNPILVLRDRQLFAPLASADKNATSTREKDIVGGDEDEAGTENSAHAVVAVGYRHSQLYDSLPSERVQNAKKDGDSLSLRDVSPSEKIRKTMAGKGQKPWAYAQNDIVDVYVHDDRLGPYFRASIADEPRKRLCRLKIGEESGDCPEETKVSTVPVLKLRHDKEAPFESWKISHIVVPAPRKTRVNMPMLYKSALVIANKLFQLNRDACEDANPYVIRIDVVMKLSSAYLDQLWLETSFQKKERIRVLAEDFDRFKLSRQIGIVRLEARDAARIDVVVDVTDSEVNTRVLAVVPWECDDEGTLVPARRIAADLDAPVLLTSTLSNAV